MLFFLKITANHLGYFEFRLCKIDGWEGDATQECLNKTKLEFYETNDENYNKNARRYRVKDELRTAELKIVLPKNLTCKHCVL